MKIDRSYLAWVVVAFSVACLVYVAYSWFNIKESDTDVLVDSVLATKNRIEVKSNDLPEPTQARVSDVTTPAYNEVSAEEFSALKEWTEKVGYYTESDRAVYNNYDDSVLVDLAKNGDVLALETLGGKYIDRGNSAAAEKYYWQAAALGSTGSLETLAMLSWPNITHKDEAGRKAALLESVSRYKTAALRGDVRTYKSGMSSFKLLYEHNFGRLELSGEDLLAIDNRANQIYESLQQRRNELGLGNFDNSTPDVIKKVYSSQN